MGRMTAVMKKMKETAVSYALVTAAAVNCSKIHRIPL